MGFLDKIFGKKPESGAIFKDDILGALTWNVRENVWKGQYREIPFSLEHNKNQMQPGSNLIKYAQTFMKDISILEKVLAKEKELFIDKFPGMKNIPEQLDEIDSLSYEEFFFSFKHDSGYVFATLGPENDERCWRIEFSGTKSIGLGFDT